jgi:hypothetical protein
MRIILELEEGVYFAEGEGDPPRTTVKENAKVFSSTRDWDAALHQAREYRMFMQSSLINLDD